MDEPKSPDPQEPVLPAAANEDETPSSDDMAAAEAMALSEALDEAEAPEPEAFRDVQAEEKAARYQAALEEAAEAAAGKARAPAPVVEPKPGAPAAAQGAEQLPYVDDRFSKVWVGLIILTFVAILAYGFLAGRGGLLTPQPTPSPTPVVTAAPSPSPTTGPSLSPGASGSPSLEPTASPSPGSS
ncbi:MAG: hypothetical protein ACHQ15_00770 [Candidatus Limnocylindrales bacterium]